MAGYRKIIQDLGSDVKWTGASLHRILRDDYAVHEYNSLFEHPYISSLVKKLDRRIVSIEEIE